MQGDRSIVVLSIAGPLSNMYFSSASDKDTKNPHVSAWKWQYLKTARSNRTDVTERAIIDGYGLSSRNTRLHLRSSPCQEKYVVVVAVVVMCS